MPDRPAASGRSRRPASLRASARWRPAAPRAGEHEVTTGTAALVPDGDGRRGWTLMVNGVPSSHVDLDDPERLDFEYMRWVADVLDVWDAAGEPLHTLHLGGGACTLARYVAATRPASRQLVVEIDPGVVELARSAFGVRSSGGLKVRTGDAREVLTGLPDDRFDAVVRDAFSGEQVPAHLTTREFCLQVARVLAPGGVYCANIGDAVGMELARSEAATARSVFAHVALVAEPAHFHGRRYGNVVLVGSDRELPIAPLVRRLASGAVRARLLEGDEVAAFAAGRRPIED